MPVRWRITLLFTIVVFIILGIVCAGIYYFSYRSREDRINLRLSNRAITTARLLSQSELFDRYMVERIDSLTTITLTNKSVQAYNFLNRKIYSYSEQQDDTIAVSNRLLDDTRIKEQIYFTEGDRDVVSYYYTDNNARIVVICAALDVEGKKYVSQLKKILFLCFLAGVAITLVGGYIFSKRLLNPIRNINREVTEISVHNLTRRIPTGRSKDEWHDLSATLNDLLNRLQESFELQRRFISNASHELSTPLTSISSQLEIALQRERNTEEYQKVLSFVLQDVRHMNKLTQTLLEFAKAAGNKGGLEINLVRIDEILMELPSSLQRQNSKFEVSLQFEGLPENENELLVFGNAELLITAIMNIVSNACKYSPDHHAVIGFSIREGYFHVQVSDKGPGIPENELDNIFLPFYRVENSHSVKGFGLGLSLAYQIIKLHKGEITASSQVGKGTVVCVKIPSASRSGF
ncbi:MAG TPA: HAMP domain-containing sensor histidine kinase [Chitinophagaceae bacterium]|nr:HAMP domain-containing sensor histidine kinase [Chitinophagaceae bacterium]